MILGSVTWWRSLLDTAGTPEEIYWDNLFRRFSEPLPFRGDHEHPGWSPARFDPCKRDQANVKSLSALVLDYDGTENIDVARDHWKQYYGFIHTTRKHTDSVHRFRVILPFGRSVSPFEYAGIWRRIFAKSGGKLDPAPKDPSRFWYTPGAVDVDAMDTRSLFDGQPMDPDAVLAEPEAVPFVETPRQQAPTGDIEKRAAAYLARMPESISGSGGHEALWRAALALVRGFNMSDREAHAMLAREFNPRCQPAWSDRELWHKVKDASRAEAPPGYVLDDDRDWKRPTPAPQAVKEAPQKASALSVAEILNGVYTRAKDEKKRPGWPCGKKYVDKLIGGFRPGHVTVLGASTSWGKSSFAIMTANATMWAGGRVLLVSGEDTEDTYGQRIMASRAYINATKLRDGNPSPDDFNRMASVLNDAERFPFFLNGIGKTAESLANTISNIVAAEETDLVIVDYLQAFTCARHCQDRRNEVTHIARCFTDAIKGSGASGLVFSQLKRLEAGHVPTRHDLKESGDVENMAEHVLIGYVEELDGKKVPGHDVSTREFKRFVVVDKNKDGPTVAGPIELTFDNFSASFVTEAVKNANV